MADDEHLQPMDPLEPLGPIENPPLGDGPETPRHTALDPLTESVDANLPGYISPLYDGPHPQHEGEALPGYVADAPHPPAPADPLAGHVPNHISEGSEASLFIEGIVEKSLDDALPSHPAPSPTPSPPQHPPQFGEGADADADADAIVVPDIPFVVNTGAAEAQTTGNLPQFGHGADADGAAIVVPDIPFVVNTGAAEAQTGPNPPHFGEGSGGGSAPAESAHHAPVDQGEIDLGSVHVPAVADTVADQDLGPAEHYAVPDDVAPDAFDIDDN